MIDLRQNGHALAEFLREYVNLRSVTVRDIDKYEEVHWFARLPQESDCQSGAWIDGDAGEDHWLEVHKQTFIPPPKPPKPIEAWCRLDDLEKAADSMPSLLSEIPVPDESAEVEEGESTPIRLESLADHPDVEAAYERFRPSWESWANEHLRRRRIHDAYANLFSLHTRLEKQGETLELVVGLGLAHWPRGLADNPELMKHPLVTIGAKTEFDPREGVVRIRPGDDVTAGRLELDALNPALRPERDRQQEIEALLTEIGIGIWDHSLVDRTLRSLANILHAESVFGDGLEVTPPGPRGPSVSLAPVLILRRRNQAGMSRVYEQIATRMLEDDPTEIPEGWASLLDQIDDTSDDGSDWECPPGDPGHMAGAPDDEIYFPLPANAEQRRIVEGIRKHRGILVQGPPGTGKSHTIANLICHLLAAGKRVLVTAETGRALQVLRDKLPPELQPLCINLLGQTTDGLADLESSVSGIQGRHQNFDAAENARRITELQSQLGGLRQQQAGIERELLDLRAEETTFFDTGMAEYTGTPSEIARRTNEDANRFEWLVPSVCGAKTDRPAPIGGPVLAEWWRLLRDETPEGTAIATAHFPLATELPAASEFAEWTRLESIARDRAHANASASDPSHLEALDRVSESDLRVVRTQLERLRQSIVRLTTGTSEWSRDALEQVLAHRSRHWERIAGEMQRQLGSVEEHLQDAGDHDLVVTQGHALRRVEADATHAAAALRSGRKWRAFGLFVPSELKPVVYLTTDVSIDGRPVRTPADCDLASACAAVDLAIEEIRDLWAPMAPLNSNGNRRLFLGESRDRLETLEGILQLEEPAQTLASLLAGLRPAIEIESWSVEIIDELGRTFDAIDARAEARRATENFEALSTAVREHEFSSEAHPTLAELRDSLENREPAKYARCRDELIAGDDLRERRRRRIEIEMQVNRQIPGLLELVRPDIADEHWETRLSHFDHAWAWRVASNRLEHRTPQDRLGKLLRERRNITDQVSRTLAEIASSKAWAHFFARITAPQRQALQGWQAVTKKIGKGTGKSDRVSRLRREARQYMTQCRDAVPIWIMPRYLVAEMIEAAPECFDVVIADESSQLGIESLFLLYLAEKHIIVGDDQQISPSAVGISEDAVTGLRHALPKTIPHRALLESRSSLYQHAKVRLERAIVLREHFRCMPEIIQFSNDLCYAPNSTPLDPLRNYPPDRLDPLVRRFVEDGYREGGTTTPRNPVEATEIVAQIRGCLEDPRYDGLSMGVISLTGSHQAQLIERMLLQTIDPAEMHERRLICGDAYTFQGDERNIIFLSMVAAPGTVRISALTADTYVQRFNVAVSRAQDQLWLYHSVKPEDLSPKCLRHRLITYFMNPVREQAAEGTATFESGFEREVHDRIVKRGYRVRTQVSVGNPDTNRYRIDLVVEGIKGRLAVECDGEAWHGPDRYEADMARQRDLERAGWDFFRIRGGDFYREPDAALEPLWEELMRRGIRPKGEDTVDVDSSEPIATPRPVNEDLIDVVEGSEDQVVEPIPEAKNPHRIDPNPASSDRSTPTNQSGSAASAIGDDRLAHLKHLTDLEDSPEAHAVSLPQGPENEASGSTSLRYREFVGEAGPHPEQTNPGAIGRGLAAIVEVEGPVDARRACRIYLRGCGVQRMGNVLRRKMLSGMRKAIADRLIIGIDEWDEQDELRFVIRTHDQPEVIPRTRGNRTLEEIPASEIRFVANAVLEEDPGLEGETESHLRAILNHFDLTRLTTATEHRLLQALSAPNPD